MVVRLQIIIELVVSFKMYLFVLFTIFIKFKERSLCSQLKIRDFQNIYKQDFS